MHGRISIAVTAGTLAALFFLAPHHASALSCDGRLVELGDSEQRVRAVCGEPTSEAAHTELRVAALPYYTGYRYGAYAAPVPVQITVLVYDFGPTRFIDELTFENGVLRMDRVAGYGTLAGARARREARRIERTARTRDDD
jgi:hypothetical protein